VIPLLTGIDRDHGLRCGPTGYLAEESCTVDLGTPVSGYVALDVRPARHPGGDLVPPDLRGDPGELVARLLRCRRDEWAAAVPFLRRAG